MANRKATSKRKKETATQTLARQSLEMDRAKANPEHIYDQIETWVAGDFATPPWPEQKIKEFQLRIDSAFGAENAIVLVWSGDRRYGDAFLNEKGEVERKPVLLFAEQKVNDRDYCYISASRWILMEVVHGSQLEIGWDEASFASNEHQESHRIRPDKPPEFMYQHLRTIAQHEQSMLIGDMPPCCERMLAQNRICYGKYCEPSDVDIAFVGRIRERMDRSGVAQRNDEARSRKVLMDGTASTRHFIKRAKEQQAQRVKDIMLANSDKFFGDLLEKTGSTKTFKELEQIAKSALDRQDEKRFA